MNGWRQLTTMLAISDEGGAYDQVKAYLDKNP
jgi:hypothetical protein